MAGQISNLILVLLVVTSFKESFEETSSPDQIHPAEVHLSKIRDPLIPYAIRSIEDKIASFKTDQNIKFYTNFIGMLFATKRAQNQESIFKSEVLG